MTLDVDTKARLAREAAMMRYAAELMNQGGVGKFLAQEMINRMDEAENYVRGQEAVCNKVEMNRWLFTAEDGLVRVFDKEDSLIIPRDAFALLGRTLDQAAKEWLAE